MASGEQRRRPTGICRACGRSRWGLSKICRRRTCPAYAPLWAGDQRRKLFANLAAYTDGSAQVFVGAVTAPGAETLPWDRDHCARLGHHTCSGKLGCRVNAAAARKWNASASDRWRRLHRRAYQLTRSAGYRPWMLARVWEQQHRGVLHVHPVFAFGSPADRSAAHVYVEHLERLAPRYGFGYVERKIRPGSSRSAAAYLSAYFVTGKSDKPALHQSVMSEAMPRSIVHVSTELTQRTKITMRELRYRRFVWRCAPSWVASGEYKTARCIAQAWAHYGGPPPLKILKKILRRYLDDEDPG